MKKKQSRRKNKKNITIHSILVSLLIFLLIVIIQYFEKDIVSFLNNKINNVNNEQLESYSENDIPEYNGKPYVVLDNNMPKFNKEDYYKEFEEYSKLDSLGRCQVAYANISKKTMPKSGVKRGSISSIYPSGWKNKKYKGLIEGDYIYNRCHLIGWQLSAENYNELNLITGTRYFNVEGMLPFENKIADYLKQKINKNNHVLYRVTPIYKGKNLLASGVKMEAYSVEDSGKGVSFNVYVYNVQPGFIIDYSNGNSKLAN